MCSMGFSDLPETKGTVDRIVLDADGNIQGFVLAGGLEVYLPPHLSDAIRAAVFAITGTHSEMRRDSTCDWCGRR